MISAHIDDFVAQTTQSLRSLDEGDALLAASTMVCALLMSRVQVEPKRSDALLKAVRDRVLALNRPVPA